MKIFRKKAPLLRERYLDQRKVELISTLHVTGSNSTEKFWNLEERVRQEASILRECLDGHSRSRMLEFMLTMYRCKILIDSDLCDFSEEMKERIVRIVNEEY